MYVQHRITIDTCICVTMHVIISWNIFEVIFNVLQSVLTYLWPVLVGNFCSKVTRHVTRVTHNSRVKISENKQKEMLTKVEIFWLPGQGPDTYFWEDEEEIIMKTLHNCEKYINIKLFWKLLSVLFESRQYPSWCWLKTLLDLQVRSYVSRRFHEIIARACRNFLIMHIKS